MPSSIALTSTVLLFAISALADASDRDFTWGNLPSQPWQDNQSGSNDCNAKWGSSSPDSMCQTAVINGVDDVCLWAPPQPGPDSAIGNTERIEVAWCIKDGYGSRLIPEGTIQAAQFVKTPTFVQFTAVGDFTKINVPAGDAGGELDPHGADGNGNPIGGLLFSNAWSGDFEQSHEWQSFISAGEACMRACRGNDWYNQNMCPHVYDEQGCRYNENYRYEANGGPQFESCDGDDPSSFVGHRSDGSVWYQNDGGDPPPAPAPGATSNCKAVNIAYGAAAQTGNAGSSSSTSSSSSSTSTSSSSSSTVTSASSTTTSIVTSTVRPTTSAQTTPATSPVSSSNSNQDDKSDATSLKMASGFSVVALVAAFAFLG